MTPTKSALVTGGAKRVGRAIVECLSAAGYRVIFTYNTSKPAADELVQLISARGGQAYAVELDLADADIASRLTNIVRLNCNDRLDVLVNNASLFIADDTPLGPSPALQRRLFEVNAFAPANITAALQPALKVAGGCVVNFIDLLAERPWPTYSAYCASKAALRVTTMAQARLFAPHVRVNGIAPGVIEWPDAMPMADRSAYLKKVPLGRAGTPTDAAKLVLTLAEHMPYVTGDVIRLDGGRSLV